MVLIFPPRVVPGMLKVVQGLCHNKVLSLAQTSSTYVSYLRKSTYMSVVGGPIHAAATFSTAVLRKEYEYELLPREGGR